MGCYNLKSEFLIREKMNLIKISVMCRGSIYTEPKSLITFKALSPLLSVYFRLHRDLLAWRVDEKNKTMYRADVR